MENCYLDKDEVILFRDEVILLQKANNSETETELLLTNKRIIFINKTKKFLYEENVETSAILIDDIKCYNEMPYVVKKGKLIEIYAINGEYFVELKNTKQAKEFYDKTMRVASGFSKFVRGFKKASKEIKDTYDALDIDIVGTTKKAIDFAADVVIEYVENQKKGKVQMVGAVAKVFKRRQIQTSSQMESKKSEEIDSFTAENEEYSGE